MKLLRILRNIGLIILALLLIAIGIIYIKKDAIIRSAVDSAETSTGLKIDYTDAGIAFFSTFPNVGLNLDSIMLINPNVKNTDLASIKELTIGVGFWSLFSDEGYELREVIIDRPSVSLYCSKDSICNYDVLLKSSDETPDTSASGNMQLSIDHFEIIEGQLAYIDSLTAMVFGIKNWNFNLSGAYQKDVLKAQVHQDNMIMTYINEGVRFVDSVNLSGSGDLQYDMTQGSLSLRENKWSLNELKLEIDGQLLTMEDAYTTDFNFKLPSNEFKPLLSLIPAVYHSQFDEIKAQGQFSLQGELKGKLQTEKGIYPAISIQSQISDASVQYPELPQAITNIQMRADIQKEEGSLDLLRVDIEPFQMNMGKDSKLRGSLHMESLMSSPNVKGNLIANASLASLRKVVPMEDIRELTGGLDVDVKFDFNTEDLENMAYDKIELEGTASVEDLVYKSEDQPRLSLTNLNATLDARGIEMNAKNLEAGRSSVRTLKAKTGPLGAYFNDREAFVIDLTADAELIDVNEWLYSQDTVSEEGLSSPYDLSAYTFIWDLTVKELIYDVYDLKDVSSEGKLANEQVILNEASFEFQNSPFSMQGTIDGLSAYMNDEGNLNADLRLEGGRFDLWSYMNNAPEDPTIEGPSKEYFVLPADLDLSLAYTISGIDYDKINLSDLNGSINLQNRNMTIKPTNLNGMGGNLNLEGVFKTEEGSAPYFDFNIAMQSMQFSNTFNSIVTVQKIAPLFEKLQGNFDARLSAAGNLDKGMFPEIGGLDAQGFIATKRVILESYKPLNRIDQVAGTNFSTNFPLDNTKNWFAIEDGALVVEPFNFNIGNYTWSLEGRHLIGGEMNYQFSGPVPVDQIEKTSAGKKIVSEANRVLKQIPLISDYRLEQVDVTILLTGTRNQPNVSLRLANDFKDKLKQRIENRIAERKNEAKEEVEEELEETKEDVKEAAKDKIKEAISGQKDTSGTAPVDSLKKKTEDKIKEAKKKLQKWNPFKNKNR